MLARMLRCMVLVLLVFPMGRPGLGAQSGGITVAVLNFHNASDVRAWDELSAVIPEMLKTELSRSPYVQVLERTALEGVLQELALAQCGLLREQEAVTVGEMAGARYVIQGTIARAGQGQRLDAHIVEVSTGRVLGEKVEGRGQRALPHMVELLARNIIYDLTGNGEYRRQARWRSYPAPFAIGATTLFGVAALVTHLNYRDARADYLEATRLADFDRAYARANNNLRARDLLLGMTGASALVSLWLMGMNSAESNYVVAWSEPPSGAKVALQPTFAKRRMGLTLSVRW